MTLNEFKELSAAKGKHWFSPSTMQFFQSEIFADTWTETSETEAVFISSEKGPMPDSPRRYTLRSANLETGSVNTIGEFQTYETLDEAIAGLRAL